MAGKQILELSRKKFDFKERINTSTLLATDANAVNNIADSLKDSTEEERALVFDELSEYGPGIDVDCQLLGN